MINFDAALYALTCTAIIGAAVYLLAFQEECVECGHSRWQHGDNACAGSDVIGSYAKACRCNGHKASKRHGSGRR